MSIAINIKDISKTLQNRKILKEISFDVEVGDIFGYLGPNGAGKTTTIRILLGLFKADSGKLEILGHDINESETRKKIGFVLDADGLYENMTAEENILYYARIYGIQKPARKINELLDMVDLSDRARDKISSYSKGMRQRLALARAMVHDPEILILDEPTSGVDPTGQIEIRQIMKSLASKENKTIFLSSHNLDEVQRICNRIAIIDKGTIKLYGGLENLRKEISKLIFIIKTTRLVTQPLKEELKQNPDIGLKEVNDNELVFSPLGSTEISDIISILSEKGIKIEEVIKKEASLEELYSTILKEIKIS
ncbi:MAG: ABC transporter ATP-binding protein [Actinomycetota bacterium]|nr:ABC transporter ATP-binding protein [Actinomycetota bacterium]